MNASLYSVISEFFYLKVQEIVITDANVELRWFWNWLWSRLWLRLRLWLLLWLGFRLRLWWLWFTCRFAFLLRHWLWLWHMLRNMLLPVMINREVITANIRAKIVIFLFVSFKSERGETTTANQSQ